MILDLVRNKNILCKAKNHTVSFLSLGTIEIAGPIVLYWGTGTGCPVHCRIYSRIPGFSPLAASSTPTRDNQKCLQTSSNAPLGTNHPWLRTRAIELQNTQPKPSICKRPHFDPILSVSQENDFTPAYQHFHAEPAV